jgi:hypothetical protein
MKSIHSILTGTHGFYSPWRALLFIGALCLSGTGVHGQVTLVDPTNTINGTAYFDSDAEIGGNAYVDGNLVTDTINVNGTLFADSLYVENLTVDNNLYYNAVLNNFAVTGNLEIFGNITSFGSEIWGMGGSWIHQSIDLGDLTNTGYDTPAFNISSQFDSDNSEFLPTVNFTGYSANTTWVWQQGGFDAMGNISVPTVQMELYDSGNLMVNSPTSGNNIAFDPEAGEININNPTGALTVSDGNLNTITINPTAQNVVFYNATTSSSSTITPWGTPVVITSTGSGQAIGDDASVTGNYGFALGNNATASGDGGFAIGNHVTAAYYNSIVVGQWNAPISGSSSGNVASSPTDPLFVVGNGADSGNLSNALVILKNGNTTFNGTTTVDGNATVTGNLTTVGGASLSGNVSVQPQGDILMGQFN